MRPSWGKLRARCRKYFIHAARTPTRNEKIAPHGLRSPARPVMQIAVRFEE
jgi:hypothetical protein